MDKIIQACKVLEEEGLPIPIKECDSCDGTIFRRGVWFQCPDCGAMSTQYGGCYPWIPFPGDKSKEWDKEGEWAKLCKQGRARLNCLLEREQTNGS